MRRIGGTLETTILLFARLSLTLAAASAALAASSARADAHPPRHFVVFVVTSVRYQDLADPSLPHFARLLATGASGLMSARTGRTRAAADDADGGRNLFLPTDTPADIQPLESAFATIGAGDFAVASPAGRLAYERRDTVLGQEAERLYSRLVGQPRRDARILHLGIEKLRRENLAADRRPRIGALGELLHKLGLKTAIVGNSDGGEIHRESALICADRHGLADVGSVGPATARAQPDAPFGLAADGDRLLAEFSAATRNADLIVVDSGETARAARYSTLCTANRAYQIRMGALRSTDALLGRMMRLLDPERDRLLVLSPGVPVVTDEEAGSMAPIVVWGNGVQRSLLTSSSTRRRGIVSNADVAPSIIEFLGPAHRRYAGDLSGSPMRTVAHEDPASVCLALDERIANQTAGIVIARASAVVQIGAVVLCLGLALGRRRAAVALPALAPLAIITALLWSGSAMQSAALWPVLAVLSCVSLISAAVVLGRTPVESVLLLTLTAAASIVFDLLRGAPLMASSVVGYAAATGARYYGLGNEMMGLLIGCWLAASMLLLSEIPSPKRLYLLAASGTVLVLLAGLPFLGANFGGALAAGVGVAFSIVFVGEKPTWRLLLWIGLAGLLVLVAGVGLDLLLGRGSHIARAFEESARHGPAVLWDIAARKLAMNLMLLQTSLWSKLLLAYLAAAALILAIPQSPWLDALRRHRALGAAVSTAAVAAAAAFIFNDSGVLAAATCLAPAWALLITAGVQIAEPA